MGLGGEDGGNGPPICDIEECASSYRTAPPLWDPLPGAIMSIVRSVCGALLRAGSDQTPPAVGVGDHRKALLKA